jgi:tetratricopeptide (TPR) repeat protein
MPEFESLGADPARISRAVESLEAMLRIAPENLLLLIVKGDLLLAANRFKEADEHFAATVGKCESGATRSVLLEKQIGAILRQGDIERARSLTDQYVQSSASQQEKLFLLDSLACLPFMQGLRNCLGVADGWSEQALQIQPQNLSLRGTRGSLLVEQGRFEEAEALLKEVYDQSEAEIDQGVSALYLALIAKQRGDTRTACRLAKRAKQNFPEKWLLQRVEAEFGTLR